MAETRHVGEALADAAARIPEHGIRILDRRERPTFYSWPQIYERAQTACGRLQELGVKPGERVILVYPTEIAFFDAYFGLMLAGATPVPVYPPVRLGRIDEYHERTAAMIKAVDARLILAAPRVKRVLGRTVELARPELGCQVLDELPKADPVPVEVSEDDLAMVQFSSGTTVAPKPVALSHRAVLAQARILLELIGDHRLPDNSGVSWLPLYHDMGLIGCVYPALLAGTITLIAPENFIARPASWLRALSTYKGCVSPAPNFAFALCAERVKDSELEGVDLSAWALALNGAEPVAPSVLRRFNERFAAFGLRESALTPVYGMSEASLAVAFSDVDAPFRTRRFDREALASGRGVPAEDGVELVSVGKAVPRFELAIHGPEDTPLPDGHTGTVMARGPSLMDGYLGRPEATAQTIREGWLDTGDVGFIYQGELFLTGRHKDLLILRGRNHAPHELEQAVDGVPGVRTGCAAAASWLPEEGEGELLAVFVETTKGATEEQKGALPQACAVEILNKTGLQVDIVVALEPGSLPRTSSGKIRRGEALRRYRSGELLPPDKVDALHVAGLLTRSALGFWRARR